MKNFLYSLLATSTLLLTGCFNITDEIFFDKNGGGTFQTKIDAGKMMEMMEMIKNFLPDSLKDSPELKNLNLKDSLNNMWPELEKVAGVSNVTRESTEESVFMVSFKFSDINALNRAIAARTKEDTSTTGRTDAFSFEKGRLICNSSMFDGMGDMMKELGNDMPGTENQEMGMEMFQGMMDDMKHTSIYHFPGKIKDFTNKRATLSNDGKTMTLEIDMMDSKTKQTQHNDIKFN